MYQGQYALVTHLGVGDGIVQSGLAIALLKRYERIAFPAYPRHLATFQSIFANEPRISVYSVPRNASEDWGSPRDVTYDQAINHAGLDLSRQIRLGIYSGRGIGWDFTKSFYEQAGVDYRDKWLSCPIPAAWPAVKQIKIEALNGAKRIFLHDDKARGFAINRSRIPRGFLVAASPEVDHSILRYAGYMISADEIHVIDSSFFWLADSLPVTGRLYLHQYARWQRPRDFRYETFRHWNYLQ